MVKSSRWRFDRIVCFEPAPACWPALEEKADERVEICRFGLWGRTERVLLNNPGEVGASVASDKDSVQAKLVCEFRDVADWFAEHASANDEIFVKINVEGAEAEIVDRLYRSGELTKIAHLLIHFDVRKSPSRHHLEKPLREQLEGSGIDFQTADEILFGGVLRGTRNWLLWCESDPRWRDLRYKKLRQWEHLLRVRLYPLKLAARRALAHRGDESSQVQRP